MSDDIRCFRLAEPRNWWERILWRLGWRTRQIEQVPWEPSRLDRFLLDSVASPSPTLRRELLETHIYLAEQKVRDCNRIKAHDPIIGGVMVSEAQARVEWLRRQLEAVRA